ncbi:uncharacterized protein BYT42DRAFT_555098 [Radiomyces spectabilis]|uniref:uncharacterized protein n=1 Tax=Radiomyces spectabilis TaxID=64574 RepID=UPI00221F5C5E|nr:uncharacterized protein BYT42DRAFT_555098 [Radiomyces spectabilis]KAI8390982.1 hypothetical protein BYT42DRAFT_555098 [Radiomyces spectabilis]
MSHFAPFRQAINSYNSQIIDDDSISLTESSMSSSSSTILAPRSSAPMTGSTDRRGDVRMERSERPTATARADSNDDQRRCWICFGEDEDSEGRWVKTCRCSLNAHEECLLEWIDENQRNHHGEKVRCPQCGSEYQIIQRSSVLLAMLNLTRGLVAMISPAVLTAGLSSAIFIASSTYGALSVLTFFGKEEGSRLLGNPADWSWRPWLGLSISPWVLIFSKSSWGDHIIFASAIAYMRLTNQLLYLSWPPTPATIVSLLPPMRLFYKRLYASIQRRVLQNLLDKRTQATGMSGRQSALVGLFQRNPARGHRGQNQGIANNTTEQGRRQSGSGLTDREQNRELELLNRSWNRGLHIDITEALTFPVISSLIGIGLSYIKPVREYFPQTFHRSVLGACIFIVGKDLSNLLDGYERVQQIRSRRVRSYNDGKPPSS